MSVVRHGSPQPDLSHGQEESSGHQDPGPGSAGMRPKPLESDPTVGLRTELLRDAHDPLSILASVLAIEADRVPLADIPFPIRSQLLIGSAIPARIASRI